MGYFCTTPFDVWSPSFYFWILGISAIFCNMPVTIGNKIFVIIQRPTDSSVVNLGSKIKSNLPEDDPEILQKISQLISIYSIDVNDEVQNAEGMIAKILKETSDKRGKS